MVKERTWPQRMCVACREMKDKRQLLRVVRSPEGELSLDATGKAPGRGAYLCRDAVCLKRARKVRALEKALKTPISEDCWQLIEAEIGSREE